MLQGHMKFRNDYAKPSYHLQVKYTLSKSQTAWKQLKGHYV